MSDINANLIRLYIDRLHAIGEKDVRQLRTLPMADGETTEVASKQPVAPSISESTRQRLNDTFRQILSLLQSNDSHAYSAGEKFLDTLKEITIGYPAYSKEQMGTDTFELYKKTRDAIEAQHAKPSLIGSLVSCKESLFAN